MAAGLSEVMVAAIKGAIFLAGSWGLTDEFEDHPDITEDLSEDIADPTSGILTPLGLEVRNHLIGETK